MELLPLLVWVEIGLWDYFVDVLQEFEHDPGNKADRHGREIGGTAEGGSKVYRKISVNP